MAERKVNSILECEGLVRLVSPRITSALAELSVQKKAEVGSAKLFRSRFSWSIPGLYLYG